MSVQINGTNGLTFNDGSSQQTAASGFGFKNRIINGNFDIWQRGTSFTNPANSYTADRWLATINVASGSANINQVVVSPDDSGSNYKLAFTGVSAVTTTNSFVGIQQRVEDVRTFAGQSMTLAFKASVDSGTHIISARVSQVFGSGGSTSVTTYATTSATLTTTEQLYTFTISVPSIAGKTIGSSSYVGIQIVLAGNGTVAAGFAGGISQDLNSKTVTISKVQAELGSTATSFDYRPYGTELALCQRYYQQLYGGAPRSLMARSYFGGGIGYALPLVVYHKVSMRASPTSTIVGTWSQTNVSGITVASTDPSYSQIESYNTASNSDGYYYANTSSMGITMSAEL